MEKILKEKLTDMGATPELLAFIEDNFIYCDNEAIREVTNIRDAICRYLSVSVDNLFNRGRKRDDYVIPRQLCHYFAKRFTSASLATIGRVCGGVDHATVLHSIKTVQNDTLTDRAYAFRIKRIEDMLAPRYNHKEARHV